MAFKVFLYALYFFFVTLLVPAHAGPVLAAVGFIAKAVTAFAASSWIGGVIVSIGKSVVVGLLNMAIGKLTNKKQKQEAIGVNLRAQMGDDLPLSFIVGKRATAGKRKYWGTWGSDGGTPNAYFVDFLEVGAIPSYAGPQGINALWIGDKKGTIKWDEPHADGRGYPVEEFRKDGKDHCWVKYLDGSQTVADAYMVSKFGSLAERPFTDTMIGRGKQIVIVTCRFNTDLFSGNPEVLVEPAPVRAYDLRKDTTAGGSGAHRYGVPATYEPTENNAVLIYNIVRGIQDAGGNWLYGGQDVAAYRLPASAWMAAANECDRVIDGRTQFRCGAEISVDEEPTAVIEQLRLGCNGRFVLSGGTVRLLVGAPAAPVFHFTDAEVIRSKDSEMDPWPSLSDTHNTLTSSHPDPDSRWAMKDVPEYSVEEYVSDDSRTLSYSVAFRAVPYPEQVQALQKTLIEEGRRFVVHELTLPPVARLLEPGDVVAWSSRHNSYGDKLFIIERITRQRGSLQRVILRELDPNDYDPPEFIIPPTPGWIGPVPVPSHPMYGWSIEPATIDDDSGRPRRPTVRFNCAPDQDDVVRVHVQLRRKDTEDVVFDSDSTPYGAPYSWKLQLNLPGNTWFEGRGKYVPGRARDTDWSEWLAVKTLNIQFIDEDIGEGAITAAKLAAASVEFDKIADEAIRLNHFANSITPVEIGDALPTEGNFDGRQFYNTSDGKIYTWNGTNWTAPSFDLADGSVTSQKLAESSVTASKIMNEAITAIKIANDAVTSLKIADGAVIAGKLADAAVTAQKIADEAISLGKFAVGLRPVEILGALPSTGNTLGRQVFLTTDSKLYRWNGTMWLASVPATDISGQLSDAQIAAIDAEKIAGQITGTQISNDAVSAPKLAAGAVTAGKIAAGAVQAGTIAAGAVTAGTLAANAVTADNLAANSVTAGAISAGAVNANALAAGAVVADKLAAGAITADKLAVGRAANWLENSDLTAGVTGWFLNGTMTVEPLGIRTDAYAPPGGALQVRQTDAAQGVYADVFQITPQKNSKYFDVVAGKKYEFSAYLFSLRCDGMLWIQWYDASGSSTYSSVQVPLPQSGSPDFKLSAYLRPVLIATAPAGAVKARPFVRKLPTATGTDSYLWITRLFFSEASDNQTEASVWSPSGVTLVDGGNIVTNAITATHISASAITAEKLAAAAVTATAIAASSVTGDKIAANTIAGENMVAGSITAREMVISDFSNLAPGGDQLDAKTLALWSVSGTGTAYVLTGTGYLYQGSSSFIVQKTTPTSSVSLLSDYIPVEGGQQYFAEFAIMTNQAVQTSGAYYRVVWFGPDKVQLASPNNYTDAYGNGAIPTSFSLRGGKVTVPAGARFAKLQIIHHSTSTVHNLIVGLISFRRANAASLIVDGAVTANLLAAGVVTADKLAANAVTAGKIAAGAISATQLAAGAVTADKLASGSIATDKLAVGISRNVLQNSQFTAGLSTWIASSTPAGWIASFGLVAAGSQWAGPLNPTLRVQQSNNVATGYIDIRQNRPDQTGWKANCYPVTPGDTWEASVYASAHRCNVELRIEWRMADGSASYTSAALNAGNTGPSSTNPELWQRLVVRGVAPAGAVAAGIHMRKGATLAGNTDSYMFLYKPFLAQVPPYVSEAAPWSDGGFVLIDGSGIVAGAITADKMNVSSLAAISVNAGRIRTGEAVSPDERFQINFTAGSIEWSD